MDSGLSLHGIMLPDKCRQILIALKIPLAPAGITRKSVTTPFFRWIAAQVILIAFHLGVPQR